MKYVSPPRANHIFGAIGTSLGYRNQRLLVVSVIACLFLLWIVTFDQKRLISLVLSTGVVLLGLFPLWRWIGQNQRDDVPVLPLHGLFYSICFGIAGFTDPINTLGTSWVSEEELQWGLAAALLGLVSLYLSYYKFAPMILPRRPRWTWPFDFQVGANGYVVIFLFLLSFGSYRLVLLTEQTALYQFCLPVRDFFFVLLLHARWSGKLSGMPGKIFAYLILPIYLIFFSGLLNSQLAVFVSLAVWIGIVQMATTGRIPYRMVILAAGVFLLLQPVKSQFRTLVWDKNVSMSVSEKSGTFLGSAFDYYFGEGTDAHTRFDGAARAFARVNHLSVTAAIIADTPSKQPFLYGETYLPLAIKWIPRFLWPDKPTEDLGNRWAREYSYLGPDDYTTSFNLPWLSEMYMNFGTLGVIVVNFLIGLLFRFLREAFWRNTANSSSFAFGLVIAAPLMFVESNISLTIGGLIITAMVLFTTVFLIGHILPELIVRKSSQRLSMGNRA